MGNLADRRNLQKTKFDLEAAGFIEPVSGENPGSFQAEYSSDENLNAPLPLIGLRFNYHITPRWDLNFGGRYLAVEVGRYDGRIIRYSIGTDYFFGDKFGIGASLGGFGLKVKEDQTSHNKKFDIRYDGLQIYLVYRH